MQTQRTFTRSGSFYLAFALSPFTRVNWAKGKPMRKYKSAWPCVSICVKEGVCLFAWQFSLRVCRGRNWLLTLFYFNLHVSFIKKKATRSFFLFKYLKHDSDIQICRPFSDGFDISAPTDDAIETWITNKHMKQRKSVLTKSCLSEKKEKLFLKANAWICSDIYLRGYNYWHLFIKMTSSTYLNKN